MPHDRFVFLLSAPSGTGKTSVIRGILEAYPDLRKIVTTTSRPMRSGEVDGIDHYFVSQEEFHRGVQEGEFIEWKDHFGHRYGLTWTEFKRNPEQDAIFDMDVFGKDEFLGQVNARCITIFLAPPSMDAIEDRIRGREVWDEGQLRERLGRVMLELGRAGTYDFIVVNRDLEDAVKEVSEIIDDVRETSHPAAPKFVCIEGLIGAGKTTLAQMLAASLGGKLYLDPYDENPFLGDFYLSRRSHALETELSFALLRHRLMQRIHHDLLANRLVVADFTMWRSEVFATINLAGKSRDAFHKVYQLLCQDISAPDLLVWIDAPRDLLMKRIRARGRPEEILGVSEPYLDELEAQYRQLLQRQSALDIVTVAAEEVDLVHQNNVLASLADKIRGY